MPYNSAPQEFPKGETLRGNPMRNIGDEPMKRAIRISVLMVGLVGTFIAAAIQQVPPRTVAHSYCAHPDDHTAQHPCD